LTCEHCSTSSTLESEEYSEDPFRRLVASFTPSARPDFLVLTGGEPLLRPKLCLDLTVAANAAGSKVALASGMFFLRSRRVPSAIASAVEASDHLTISLDRFHERQVPRQRVLDFVRRRIDAGGDASFLVTGLDEHDRYLPDVIQAIRSATDDRVPILVGLVRAVGRATEWLEDVAEPVDAEPVPCDLATWPVVACDGRVVGCCNDEAIHGATPEHLAIGHAGADDWATLLERHTRSPMLRAIRVTGPTYLAERYGSGKIACDGYCGTCRQLSDDPAIPASVARQGVQDSFSRLEGHVATLTNDVFATRHAPPGYAELARLGAQAA
jgi:hypothetical protein